MCHRATRPVPFIGDRRDGDVCTRLITNTISGRGNLNYADYSHDAVNDLTKQAANGNRCSGNTHTDNTCARTCITIIAAIIVNIATISAVYFGHCGRH